MSLIIQKFKYNQSLRLLSIYNSARVRGFFYKKNRISFDEHISFLVNKLEKKNCIIYLAFINNNSPAIGYVRFDKLKKSGIYEISIATIPKYYGKGYGSIMIKTAISKLKIYKFKKIIAVVKKNNQRSFRFFIKNNFKLFAGKSIYINTINPLNLKKEYCMYYNNFDKS